MNDLVRRLRESATVGKIGGLCLLEIADLFTLAANRIEALEAALEQIDNDLNIPHMGANDRVQLACQRIYETRRALVQHD